MAEGDSRVTVPALPGLDGTGRVPTRPRATTVAQRLREVTRLVYADAGFVAFWAAYPNKTNKPEAAEAWHLLGAVAHPAKAAAVLEGVQHWARTWEWHKDRGAYVPRPDRFFSQQRWEARPDLRKGLPSGSTWVPPPVVGMVATSTVAVDEDTSGDEDLAALRGEAPERIRR